MAVEAAPIVVDPSGIFLGNDGAWSTFSINVGSPPQALCVIASTEQSATWAVVKAGCHSDDASNCTDARGGTFDATRSSTWFRKDVYQLNEAVNLGYDGNDINGTYGFDTLTVRAPSGGGDTSIEHQVVAGISTDKFYLGSLGLAPHPINFTTSADSSSSFLSSLRSKNMIPSLAFGYTAGASYKQGGVNASLTLGGYDTSRFVPNEVSFPFARAQTRQLVVGLQSITYSDSKNEKSLLSEGILALVDSTVPYIWLPQTACEAFESAFGISWDPIHNLYTVDGATHNELVETNPSVGFQLVNSHSGGPSVNITLPYASFDLNASYPLTRNETRYFPLQRAPDANSFTLGRTFLQEAYIIVDHEASTFSVSQSKFDANTPSNIVAIAANATSSSPAAPTLVKTTANGSHGIGTGAIAGLAIAIAIVGIVVALGAFFCMRRRRRAKKRSELPSDATPPDDPTKGQDSQVRDSSDYAQPKKPDFGVTVTEVPMTPLSEIDGREFLSSGTPWKPTELPGEQIPRSELSTPEPFYRPELPSSHPQALRSELSTPEPIYMDSELPTPDPSHELDSPDFSATNSHPSPNLGSERSALNSPLPCQLAERPFTMRMDSSESESGFRRADIHPSRQTVHSDASNSPTATKRPRYKRMGTDEPFGNPYLGRMSSSVSEAAAQTPAVSSLVPATARSILRQSMPEPSRPQHQRLVSADSETWETRLEMSASDNSPPVSRFGTMRQERGPSDGAGERKPVPDKVSDDVREAKQ